MARRSPLLYPAAFLSAASLAWTTWSLVDLLGAGIIGITVAAGADIIWGSVIVAEARGTRPGGKRWAVPAIGIIAILAVAAFLFWHGISRDSWAMAAVGPFLPLGAKVVWMLALADMRDPAALTDDEKATLAAMERRIAFEEAQHASEMRRLKMQGALLMAKVSTDFDIELMRQDKTTELMRRRPMELPASPTPHPALPGDAPTDDAPGETPDGADDAPLLRPVPASPAASRRAASQTMRDTSEMRLTDMSKAAAVRVVRDKNPDASAPQIVERLAHHGVDADAAYVRTVLSRINKQRATTGGYL
ncbi:hypothetical protein ACWGUL_01165 [Streptomyces albidoflavus]